MLDGYRCHLHLLMFLKMKHQRKLWASENFLIRISFWHSSLNQGKWIVCSSHKRLTRLGTQLEQRASRCFFWSYFIQITWSAFEGVYSNLYFKIISFSLSINSFWIISISLWRYGSIFLLYLKYIYPVYTTLHKVSVFSLKEYYIQPWFVLHKFLVIQLF